MIRDVYFMVENGTRVHFGDVRGPEDRRPEESPDFWGEHETARPLCRRYLTGKLYDYHGSLDEFGRPMCKACARILAEREIAPKAPRGRRTNQI